MANQLDRRVEEDRTESLKIEYSRERVVAGTGEDQ